MLTSLFAMTAATAPPDMPVSPNQGNGEDAAPPPDLQKTAAKRKKAKAAEESEGEFPPAPEIQPEGKMPSVRDAMASPDDEEEEAPPFDPTRLRHSSNLPKGAFRAYPREGKGFFLWMFSVPYGEGVRGEAFTQPIATDILKDAREQTTLEYRKFEIRLLVTAGEGFVLFEAPTTPMKTPDAEEKRKSIFDVLDRAEKDWVIAEKSGGRWGTTKADYTGPFHPQPKPIFELADATYKDLIVRTMDKPVLMRYRRPKR
jgi:hypothetical protein